MEPAAAKPGSTQPGSAPKRASPETAGPTPVPRSAAAPLRVASWDQALEAYLLPQGSSPPAQRGARARLAEAVQRDSGSPEAWWAFLQAEEEALAGGGAHGGATATLTQGVAQRGGVSLFDLYLWATKQIPRQNNYSNEAYLKIWLGYARQQWLKNQDDARDTFKTLRSQHVGDRSALLYYEWAALEQLAGHSGKALGVLQKGLREQAQPAGLLEQMQQELQQGKFVYRPPWAASTGAGGSSLTGHSNGTYAAFLTPGGLDQRRLAATPTLEGIQGGSTETVVLSKPAAAGAAGQSSSAAQPAAGPGAGGAGGRGGSSGEDTIIVPGAKARPLAGTGPAGSSGGQQQRQHQHTGTLAELYANRTSHTFSSSSTGTAGGSQETTVALRHTPNAGLSHHSNSTTGSIGEEATVCLRKPGSGGSGTAGTGPAGRPGEAAAGASGRDDTVIVNRSSLLKAAVANAGAPEGGPARDPSLPKPRRMGMLGLGRALRVTPGSAPPAAPEPAGAGAAAGPVGPAGSAEDAEATHRKRKAEAEAAHSPKPPAAAGDFKRRSPCSEAGAKPHAPAAEPTVAAQPSQPRQRPLPPIPRFDGSSRPSVPPASTAPPTNTATEPAAAPAAGSAHSSGATAAAAAAAAALPPRPGGVPAAAAAPARRQQVVLKEPGEAEGGSDDETVPHVMSKLALKIAKGRQSLAPGKIVMKADGAVVGPNETSTSLGSHDGDGEDDDAPTLPVARPQPAVGAGRAGLAAEEDPEATKPLSRPAALARASPPRPAAPARQVQIDGAGNVKLQQPPQQPALAGRGQPAAPPRRMPVPPPPPPSLPGDENRPLAAAALPGAGAAAPASARVPMGPPAPMPPKHLRAQHPGEAPGAGTPEAASAATAAAAQQPRRRVIEDENTIVVKGIAYTKLECVGRGGSSKVYKVMAPNRKIFALKRIRLSGRDSEAASGFLDEITLLNKLKGRSNIIQLIDSEVHRNEGIIYMVLECGDIDLARLLQKHEKARQEHVNADEVDENFIRLYWEQMLQAVYSIHEERIVHSDLKPANFLMVEGVLKLIDFGIAKAIQADTTSIARESQVGTLNYMSPEAILGGQNNIRGGPPMKVGRPSDVWSLGCILYQMVYGHTPFSHLPFIQKMHAIIDANHRIAFPPIRNRALMDVMQRCLDRNPRSRITMKELLDHPFLRPTQQPVASGEGVGGALGSGEVRLSKEQLTKLLLQVSQAGVGGHEVAQLSDELFRQMSNGLSPNVLASKAATGTAEPAGPAAAAAGLQPGRAFAAGAAAAGASRDGSAAAGPQQRQQQAPAVQRRPEEPASVAEAAARAAAARAGQRAAAVAEAERRPRAAAESGRAPLAPISQSAIAQQAAALRKVDAAAHKAAAPQQQQQEGGLEAALRKGLERFKFDDTQGTTALGDDTTGDFI